MTAETSIGDADLFPGVDVQAELSIKAGSPLFDGNTLPPQMPAPSMAAPLQRAAVNRQHARRSYQSVNGRASSTSQFMSRPQPAAFAMQSPTNHPTPPSHASSPAAASSRSVTSMHQTGLPSPASAAPSHSSSQYQQSSALSTISTSSSRSAGTVIPGAHGYGFPNYPKQTEPLGKYPCPIRAH